MKGRRDIVAAVCHRGAPHAVELLVVRTKGGKYWTFPKGHVESGETPTEAAAREAEEEAGVTGGVIASTPLTRYRYPGSSDEEGEADVTAYLLEVVEQGPPAERRREPKWLAPDEATRLLATGREPEYAEEHARVVREAIAVLSRPA